MLSDLISEMYRLEETYWWHVAKRRMVFSSLTPYLKSRKGVLQFVDVGCGTGMMLTELSSYGNATGIDGSAQALIFCKKRGLDDVVMADLAHTWPLRTGMADVVTMLDVLEHLDSDAFALREVHRVLKPGGLFVLTVPAYPALWTYWDEALGHKRRYRRTRLVEKLHRTGFVVVRRSYFYTYLLPLAIFFRLAKTLLGHRARTHSDFVGLPPLMNRILLILSTVETEIVKRASLPAGLSIICVCKKV